MVEPKSLIQIISESNRDEVPIVYLEGPRSNLSTGEMIRSRFPSFIPLVIDSEIPTELSDESITMGAFGVNLSDFPPRMERGNPPAEIFIGHAAETSLFYHFGKVLRKTMK